MIHSRTTFAKMNGKDGSVITGAFSVNYGILNNLELEFVSIMYQDLNKYYDPSLNDDDRALNLPGNYYLRWKLGSFRINPDLPLYLGLQGSMHAPFISEAANNIWLEPYHAERMSIQVNGLLSYYRNDLFLDDDWHAHLNFGYINFNDADRVNQSSEGIQLNTGLHYPFDERWAGSIELHALTFIDRREHYEDIFSIEDYLYVTPSVRYRFSPIVSWRTGLDVLLYDEDNKTRTSLQPDDDSNYPAWRVTSKLSFAPSGLWFDTRGQIGPRGFLGGAYGAANRAELFDWDEETLKDIEYLELELQKIREQRRKTEEELQRIKKNIEKEEKSSP